MRNEPLPQDLIEFLKGERLVDDPNFYILAIYYRNLRKGGDGEMLVKLLKGKLTVKGATYLKKVVGPSLRIADKPQRAQRPQR